MLDWDSHLFALKQLAEAEGTGLSDFFMDKAYLRINTVDLYTTPLTSDVVNDVTTSLRIGAFAPTSPHGYGISYGITVSSSSSFHFRPCLGGTYLQNLVTDNGAYVEFPFLVYFYHFLSPINLRKNL